MLKLFTRRPSFQAAAAVLDRYAVLAETRTRLATFLETAPDREVYHFNPRYLAEHLNLAERPTLKLLVAALYEGLVTLHWDVRCPVCGTIDHRADSFGKLHHQFKCPACQAVSTPHLDDEVRVTFSPHPRFRAIPPSAADKDYTQQIDARFGPVPGHALLLLPEFQRLFPQERLLPEESLEVARTALLFTDLAGSTALYAARGDPRAYHLVRLHFDELIRAADEDGGVVVKNIGDAVMAAFQTPVEALRAALAMQQNINVLNARERLTQDEQLILKVGLHSGPCLSVTLNNRPDYFGTTVNIAARVQGLSRGGDVVFTEAIRTDAEAQAVLGAQALESSRVVLKGIDEELLVHRLSMLP